jgi:tRNA/tmRNA/rRNA uracil-C5-methylase (TrmA/RlmC/RlmD family)
MLSAGDAIDLTVEKPAAGGRMLARHDGRVVFVRGAIPGERVRARVEKVERQLAFASAIDILQPSPDRRAPLVDLACGGCSYAHVAYTRQLALKSEVIGDAFARVGRRPLEQPVSVLPSPERGYRMRARFHVQGLSVGFYREGTHQLCDAGTTGQLLDESVAAVTRAVTAAVAQAPIASAEVAENMAADERVVHLEAPRESVLSMRVLAAASAAGGLTGCSARAAGKPIVVGTPFVSDPLPALTGGRARSGVLTRHADAFFQANRYLLPELVAHVLDLVLADGTVLDLYAGVGLFSVSLARSGRGHITAVEGDSTSVKDLADNAAACGASIHVVRSSVEDYLASSPARADTLIVDPPRTGMSREAMSAAVRTLAARVIYVSCDPPTMARDARRLLDGGYRLAGLRAFDLFPNTPHVETVGVFERGTSAGSAHEGVE